MHYILHPTELTTMLLLGRLFSLPQTCITEESPIKKRLFFKRAAAAEEGKFKVIDVDARHWIMLEKPGVEYGGQILEPTTLSSS